MSATPRSRRTKDESDRGGDRPGAGAAPVPKAAPPQTKTGSSSSADVFRRASRRITRRIIRKRIRKKIRGTGVNKTQRLIAFKKEAGRMLRQEMKAARDVAGSDRYELRSVESSAPSQSGNDVARSAGAEDRSVNEGVADVSAELRSEMAALFAFYATRIGAVRRSLNRTTADVIIMTILGEQAVAVRALTDRWHAAAERQRTERLTGDGRRNNGDLHAH